MTSANSGYDWSYVATTNIYPLEQWQLMEDAGAVFLPCVGFRGGKSVSYVGTLGNSWSSSAYSISNSHYLDFKSNTMSAQGSNGRFRGRSVRLVAELPETVCGTIETTDGTTIWEDDLPYSWEDKTFTEAGTQTTTLKNMDGCDSVVTFTLRVRYHNIVLQENESSEYYDFFAEDYNGYTLTTATLNRQFTQGRWATLCLPFNVSKGQMIALNLNSRVYEFRYAETTDNVLTVYFAMAQSIVAGKGYIVNANAKLAKRESFVFSNVTINTDEDSGDISTLTGYNDGSGRGSIYLVGALRTGLLLGTINDNIYLGLKDNTIYYPNLNTGTSIRAYRGVFRSDEPLNAQRIRIIADGEERGELTIDNGELIIDNSPARKYIENGNLYINRNGNTYTTHGQRLD